MNGRKWTKSEIFELRQMWPCPVAVAAQKLNRTYDSIVGRAGKLGLIELKKEQRLLTLLELITEHNGHLLCLSKNRVTILCENNHIWKTTDDNIRSGRWCSKCANNQKFSSDFLNELATSHGGKFVGQYTNNHTPTKWMCKYGHVFTKTVKQIRRFGTWCTFCNPRSSSIGERLTRYYFEFFLGESFPSSRIGRYQVDGLCEKLKLAFEYDGPHHTRKVSYSKKSLYDIKRRDAYKETILLQRNFHLIRIPYDVPKDEIGEYVKESLTNLGYSIEKSTPKIESVSSLYEPLRLIEVVDAASRRGYVLSTLSYRGVEAKYDFKCPYGHEFKMTLHHFRRGTGCPRCRGYYKTVEELQKLANGRRGMFLSDAYVTSRTKYLWKCEFGHVFSMTYDNVAYGQWCGFCYRERRKCGQ